MKKFVVILLSIILAIPFVGCNNKSEELNQQYEDAMSNGKSKVIEEEYDKAIDYFELALESKKEDQEAMNLIEQLQLLEKTIEVEVDGSYFYQIKQLEKINSIDTETNVVKDKANEYKDTVIKNIDDAISDIENNIEDEKYKKSQEDLEGIIKECKEIDSLKDQLDRCNKLLDTCKEKKKEAEKQVQKEKEQKSSSNSNKKVVNTDDSNSGSQRAYCKAGEHYVNVENWDFDTQQCHGCEMKWLLTSGSNNLICEECEDGTVLYEDGTKTYY